MCQRSSFTLAGESEAESPRPRDVVQELEQDMGNVKSIETAIEALPPSELAEFRRWFAAFDAAAWDQQIERDAASGKLDEVAAEALADYRAGSVRDL